VEVERDGSGRQGRSEEKGERQGGRVDWREGEREEGEGGGGGEVVAMCTILCVAATKYWHLYIWLEICMQKSVAKLHSANKGWKCTWAAKSRGLSAAKAARSQLHTAFHFNIMHLSADRSYNFLQISQLFLSICGTRISEGKILRKILLKHK
jgi:hypothetical protein